MTYWNGEACVARQCIVTVSDDTFFVLYWAKHLVGQNVKAVEVDYNGTTRYLYDEDGTGWYKVTIGRGLPSVGHKDLTISKVVSYI